MKHTIEASLLDSLKGLVDNFSKTIEKSFKSLSDDNLEVSNGKQGKSKDGSAYYIWTVTTANNHKVRVKVLPSAGRTNLYDLYLLADNNKKQKYLGIQDDEVEDKIESFIEDTFGLDSIDDEDFDPSHADNFDVDDEEFEGKFENASSSQKLQVTLHKINGSDEIELGPVFCDYQVAQAYDDLEFVLDDDEFVESLPDEPQAFEITSTDDEYDVQEIDNVDTLNTPLKVVKAQVVALLGIENLMLKYDTKSVNDDLSFENKFENAIYTLEHQLTWMLRNFEIQESAPLWDLVTKDELNDTQSLTVDEIMENYTLTLEFYRPNFDDEVQSLFNDWLLSLRYSGR